MRCTSNGLLITSASKRDAALVGIRVFSVINSSNCAWDNTVTLAATPSFRTSASSICVAASADARLPALNTTLPLLSTVFTSVMPRSPSSLRRSAMATRLARPTLMPRKNATWRSPCCIVMFVSLAVRTLWQWCHPGQAQHESGALAHGAVYRDGAAKLLGNQVEYDVQSQSRATLAAPRGDKGIEDTVDQVRRNAAAIVTHLHVDPVRVAAHADMDAARRVGVKRVLDAVQHQIGQHLRQGTRIAVKHDF